ncbi:MAG: DMT family protein [Sphingomonadaceae bacterium]
MGGAVAFVVPVILLALSNLVMNVAWYANLKFPGKALWLVILASWGLAIFEYVLAVPANRIGAQAYSLAQLKTITTVFSLATFVVVAWVMFGQKPNASQLIGFALIAFGSFFIFRGQIV